MADKAFLLKRVSQLQDRYRGTYGSELTTNEVVSYLKAHVYQRQMAELAVLDSMPTAELLETLDILSAPPPPVNDNHPVMHQVNKPRGRPKKVK
jgi:hypothetical protein